MCVSKLGRSLKTRRIVNPSWRVPLRSRIHNPAGKKEKRPKLKRALEGRMNEWMICYGC
jgi:hypothetical protein